MKISVIVPTYKSGAYLKKCLQSLHVQTLDRAEYEVLVVLNGSKDPYYDAATSYIKECEGMNITLLYDQKASVSHARNIGLDNARGEYITFVDDDDYVSERYLEGLLESATADTVSLCHPQLVLPQDFTGKVWDIEDTYFAMRKGQKASIFSARKYFAGPWMKLIHRDIIGRNRFDETFSNGEDTLFSYLISNKIRNIKLTDADATYYYCIRGNSLATRQREWSEIMKTNMRQTAKYFEYTLKSPFSYNIPFFITRIGGCLRYMFVSTVSKIKLL